MEQYPPDQGLTRQGETASAVRSSPRGHQERRGERKPGVMINRYWPEEGAGQHFHRGPPGELLGGMSRPLNFRAIVAT